MTTAGTEAAVDDRRAFAQSRFLMTRDPQDVDWSSVVHSDPGISGGTPVFRGTRVPTQTLFDYLEGGETLDRFLDQFPSVSRAQAVAALDLARKSALAGV